MVKFRNVRVRMKGGKTRIQRAMVLASGKLRFVKNISRSRSSAPRHKTRRIKTRSVRSMVRRRHRRGRSRKSLVGSLEKIGTGVALVAPAAAIVAETGFSSNGAKRVLQAYTGYNANTRSWSVGDLAEGWAPIVGFTVAKVAAHKIIGLIRRF